MLNFEVQNTLAKLLARENVEVRHGNYPTAFFDVENRVLGLPLWKNRGKDVYDLLVGHEVGHALFTPSAGWHESVVDLGIPRSYVNVVEDIRIERLIQAKYPGLVSSFKRGYKVLSDEDFFGLSQFDSTDDLGLMDRINVKAKLRDLVEVKFSAEEQPLVDMAFAANTFDEVIEACKALYEFLKEKRDNDEQQNEAESSQSQSSDSSEDTGDADSEDWDNADQSGDEASNEESGSDSDDGDTQSSAGPTKSGEEESSEDNESTQQVGSQGAGDADIDRILTDEAFRSNEENLLEKDEQGYQPQYVRAISREQLKDMVVDYKELAQARKEREIQLEELRMRPLPDAVAELDMEYMEFLTDTKKFVNLMAKEFEMRKAAYQSQRAQTARSGSLDVNRLHAYKYTDDIFARVTHLADAKSHGMVMFIDLSGSMQGILKDTVKQTLTLAMFCKKVNIPFDVYTFTTGGRSRVVLKDGEIDHTGTQIVQVVSSSLKKTDYLDAMKGLYALAHAQSDYYTRNTLCDYEGMGGTPLNETIMAARFILADFQKKHGVQKVNAVFLTDGEAQSMYINRTRDNNTPTRGYVIDIDGKTVTAGRNQRNVTDDLIAMLGKKYTVIGFFLCERSYDFRAQVWKSYDEFVSNEKMNDMRKTYNKQKFISFDGARGYDRYFVVKAEGRSLNTDAEEFEVSEEAKKGEIARAFKKFANSKKANRMLATQFAQMVA